MSDYSKCNKCGAERVDVFMMRHRVEGRKGFTRLHTYKCGSDCAVVYPKGDEYRKVKCEATP